MKTMTNYATNVPRYKQVEELLREIRSDLRMTTSERYSQLSSLHDVCEELIEALADALKIE